jgi:hypothetical protein
VLPVRGRALGSVAEKDSKATEMMPSIKRIGGAGVIQTDFGVSIESMIMYASAFGESHHAGD